MKLRALDDSRAVDRKREPSKQDIDHNRAFGLIGPVAREAKMKKHAYITSLAVIALMGWGTMTALAQSKARHPYADQAASAQAGKQGAERMNHDILKRDISDVASEPHQVLTRAFMQNIETFTKVLSEQAQGNRPLSADFARAAVAEIIRNFDEANTHHQEHVKTMRPGRPSRMSGIGDMTMRDSKLRTAIDTLEKDVQTYTLNLNQIATDCAEVLKHLDAMAKTQSQE